MPNYPIKLGHKMSSPAMPTSPSPPSEDQMYYPCLYLEWDKSYDLPDEGTMTVRFKKKAESTSTRNGETRQTVELDITAIEDVEGEMTKKDSEPSGDLLDRVRELVMGEEDSEGEGY